MMKMWSTRGLIFVQMCFNVSLMPVLIGLLSKWSNIRGLGHKTPQEQYICFPTDLMTQDDGNIKAKYLKALTLQNNGTVFCGVASEVLKVGAESALDRLYDDSIHPEYKFYHELIPKKCTPTNDELPKIKMIGPYVEDKENATIQKTMWTIQNVTRGKDISYSTLNGTITVKHDGYYFVGSQVQMQCKPPFDVTIFDHFIYMTKPSPTYVLKNSKPIISIYVNVTTVTSSTGAVFLLNEGDQLYVATSPGNCVHDTDTYPHSNYFHVFKV